MRFVCTGDLHVGSGDDLSPGKADGRLADHEQVLAQIVDIANELDAPLLFAGDAWEHRRPTPPQILAVGRQFARVKRGVIAIPGNHDVEAWQRPTGLDVLVGDRLTLAGPGPAIIAPAEYALACLPWAPASRLVALDPGGDRDQLNVRLAAGLLDVARGLFTQMPDDRPRILMAHWSVSGASTPTGLPTDLFREPVLDLAELEAIGFDAVVLGHIHKPQLLSTGAAPIFYVGSPLPLNFGEAASDHCCWLLDTDAGAFQMPLTYPQLVTVDLTGAQALEINQSEWPLGEPSVAGVTVKIRVRATREEAERLDVGLLKREAIAAGATHVWQVQLEVERAGVVRGPAIDDGLDDQALLRLWLESAGLEATDDLLALHGGYAS
jgi:DNA repair exonuclease SbcCD nuclease subunit